MPNRTYYTIRMESDRTDGRVDEGTLDTHEDAQYLLTLRLATARVVREKVTYAAIVRVEETIVRVIEDQHLPSRTQPNNA